MRAVGVQRGRGGRTRVAHRRAGGQHDGRGHAGKVGKQQSSFRATGQKAIPRAGLRLARWRRPSVVRVPRPRAYERLALRVQVKRAPLTIFFFPSVFIRHEDGRPRRRSCSPFRRAILYFYIEQLL